MHVLDEDQNKSLPYVLKGKMCRARVEYPCLFSNLRELRPVRLRLLVGHLRVHPLRRRLGTK